MPETIFKAQPDRDLQSYFFRPSAIAALSGAAPDRFTLSGTWRQQFDWAVVEWNRDNVIEHPALRNLPDGDFSGLQLTYTESRGNCIPMYSDLYATVDWPFLRIWADDGSGERIYCVRLYEPGRVSAPGGGFECATCEFELSGTPTTNDYVGLAFCGEHHTHQVYFDDTLEKIAQAITASINAFSAVVKAERTGTRIKLFYTGPGQTREDSTAGANGNRFGAYSYVAGEKTEVWDSECQRFSGGVSPEVWNVSIDFTNLLDVDGQKIPTHNIRKMRWTYAAALQPGAFERSDFQVSVWNWQVTGSNRVYQVAGPGSRRVDDDDEGVVYQGNWSRGLGNFSGGTIRWTTTPGSQVQCEYRMDRTHRLYLGTRYAFNGGAISVSVDGCPPEEKNLCVFGEDTLARFYLGEYPAGSHTVVATHAGQPGQYFYFDFVEAAVPTANLPDVEPLAKYTPATDWDTDHSLAIPAERTAWLIHKLGFRGRVNHYVGALEFYELYSKGTQYATATITFSGIPIPSDYMELRLGWIESPDDYISIRHLIHFGDTPETVALAMALHLNSGYTAVWAEVDGTVLTIHARAMGLEGQRVTVRVLTDNYQFQGQVSTPPVGGGRHALAGAADGRWTTDLDAPNKLNRAAIDWSAGFFTALHNYGLDVVSAFSMELKHADDSFEEGIAQRYPSGNPAWLNTPALQTNFSPRSTAYWREVHLEMALLMQSCGLRPYMQFGEVQWWYFPSDGSGMPFYDAYTQAQFQAIYGRPMALIPSHHADPALYPEEVAFLPTLIGAFTAAIRAHVLASVPDCRFEVLYPTDVNDTPFNRAINFPCNDWTPASLDCLKTESFTYTYTRDLNASLGTIAFSRTAGFPDEKRAHLVGVGDSVNAWLKEARMAEGDGLESVVLWALDQFCLIGYSLPIIEGARRSLYQG